MSDWLGLSGKTCVVTGARGGLGLAISQAFLEAGARVLMLDLPPQGPGPDVPEALARFAPNVAFAAVDVGDDASVAAAFARCEAVFGAPSILINNAAMSAPAPSPLMTLRSFSPLSTALIGTA